MNAKFVLLQKLFVTIEAREIFIRYKCLNRWDRNRDKNNLHGHLTKDAANKVFRAYVSHKHLLYKSFNH